MSYEYDETTKIFSPIMATKIMYCGIVAICALVSYCCCRRRQNTGTVLSQPIENSSNYNAALIPAIPLPPPRTNNYQAAHIQSPQPASNAASWSDASDLPPSYDQFYAKELKSTHHTNHAAQ